MLETATGVKPLLSITEPDGQALVLIPTDDGYQLVLGIVDRAGDNAVVVLTEQLVDRLLTVLSDWYNIR